MTASTKSLTRADLNDMQLNEKSSFVAPLVVLFAMIVRLWMASGTFLNPDEALHFRLANQLSFSEAYKTSLTASHPPLLTFILYFWRTFGASELWLRLPSVLAGVAFCWLFYKWLVNASDRLTGLIGLLLVAFLPPIVTLAIEIRQYALLLMFLAGAVFFIDRAITKNSAASMWAFSLCLYLAMLSHYSAFLFAAALGMYVLVRLFQEKPPATLILSWATGQLIGIALAIVLYKTHISKLGVGESRTAAEGWMSEFFLRNSYFDPAHDHRLTFLVGHTFGVFQYFFGQLAIGDLMGVLFIVAIVLLFKKNNSANPSNPSRWLGIFLILPFAVACIASVTHTYPYGGTRHMAFLIIPGIAGVSVAIARLSSGNWLRGIVVTVAVLVTCIAFGKPRKPYIDRADQSHAHMAAAIAFIQQNLNQSDFIFTGYETDLVLGHYLCEQRPIPFEPAPPGFEQFSCMGHRVVSRDYKGWMFSDDFPQEWQRFVQAYALKPERTVWVMQAGWDIHLPEDLRAHYEQYRDLQFESFGKNIKIFKLTVN